MFLGNCETLQESNSVFQENVEYMKICGIIVAITRIDFSDADETKIIANEKIQYLCKLGSFAIN